MKLNNVEVSGLVVLFIGVILLGFTFVSAYGFLAGNLSILASADLVEVFGRAMAPLIEAVIHILYLGVMGWIGSILTIRGVQLVKQEKTAVSPPQPQQQTIKQQAKQPVPAPAAPAPAPSAAVKKSEPKPDAKVEEGKGQKADVIEPKKAENQEKASAPEPPKEPQLEAPAQ